MYCRGIIHLYVRADAPWKTLAIFADAKTRQISWFFWEEYHSDFVIEAFKKESGNQTCQCPYKSCSETVTALLGGHISGLLLFLHGAIGCGANPDFGDCRP
jgi:tripartite-type tricarboxylate transporter receptor subunit TctC